VTTNNFKIRDSDKTAWFQ